MKSKLVKRTEAINRNAAWTVYIFPAYEQAENMFHFMRQGMQVTTAASINKKRRCAMRRIEKRRRARATQ